MIDLTLLTAWRAWHNRNEITHDKPLPSVESSKRFLCSYLQILRNSDVSTDVIFKGKQLVITAVPVSLPARPPKPLGKPWSPPPAGWAKLSIDGSFKAEDGTAGCGMMLRGDAGQIIFSACRFLPRCVEAVEAELWACREGLELAMEHSMLPIIVESDCSLVISAAMDKTMDRSPYLNIISDIKLLARQSRFCKFVKVDRSEVRASHFLANLARVENRTEFWFGSSPDFQELNHELAVTLAS
jgi:ribonuclease HI